MIKSALIIVPHQDDELNISGFILNRLCRAKVAVNILYVTKGNFYRDKYLWRQQERDRVLDIFGDIKYKQLGYNDSYDYKNHTFNDIELRNDVERDIYDYILKCRSDLVVCVDFDLHADHRMVSSLFDRAMCKILKEKHNYNPIVLKKFAYLGVWTGYNDYFNIKPMRTCEDDYYREELYIDALPNSWDDRICVRAEESDCSLKFWKSKVFKAYITYWTQCGYRFFFKAANTDVTYWFRNTENLMMSAKINADSGNTNYINDFSLGNIDLITESFENVESKFPHSAWVPNDDKKELTIQWDVPVSIKTIKLYQNFRKLGHINSFQLTGNGYSQTMECDDSDVNYFYLNKEILTDWLTFKMLDASGNAGIRELEMYTGDGKLPWSELPFEEYKATGHNRTKVMTRLSSKIQTVVWIILRIENKIRKRIGLSHWGN